MTVDTIKNYSEIYAVEDRYGEVRAFVEQDNRLLEFRGSASPESLAEELADFYGGLIGPNVAKGLVKETGEVIVGILPRGIWQPVPKYWVAHMKETAVREYRNLVIEGVK